jgi:hypothetical protein
MSHPQPPNRVKLVIGLFMKNKGLFPAVSVELTEYFGPVDLISRWYPFDFTTYYEPEMGAPLFRRILAFKDHIEQKQLADIKVTTNSLEQRYFEDDKRKINIDPGYLSHERFVLATGKNFAHRIYIGKGMYADLTLIFQKGDFVTLPWTYPDYAHQHVLSYLRQVRKKYVVDFKKAA